MDSGLGGYWGCAWAKTSNELIFVLDDKGNERWNIYRVNLTSGEMKNLTPNPEIFASVEAISPKRPHEILARLNDRDPTYHDLYRINIQTGEKLLVLRNPGTINGGQVIAAIADDDYVLRFVQTSRDDGGCDLFKPDGAGWKLVESIPMEDIQGVSIEGFDESGTTFYMKDSRGRDTSAVFEVDARTRQRMLLAEDTLADAEQVLRHPCTGGVQAVSFNHVRRDWQAVDPSIEPDLAYLSQLVDGDMSVPSRSGDDSVWVVAYDRPDQPATFYLYRRRQRTATPLFCEFEKLRQYRLSPARPVVIKSRDGLDLVSYCTLPRHAAAGATFRPPQPLPMVLYVHGGPHGRDSYRYRETHQWLADRGYAVLAVNFRGSTGFGKKFLNASIKEWAGRMHDDLIDAVKWAIDSGIADPGRLAIFGGSYGGYAALVGLTFTPDVFACAVAMSGISRLTTFLDCIPAHWKPKLAIYRTRLGDHTTEPGRQFLDSRSPLTFVDRISRPLLLGHGGNDPRCPRAEADQIAAAMNASGVPFVYALFPDEGHGWTRLENRLSFYAVAEEFLARCLGGAHEPVGQTLTHGSIELHVGGNHIRHADTQV
jgi:dipeptidyl aminopeptidase/acylaminoacyl peptidase